MAGGVADVRHYVFAGPQPGFMMAEQTSGYHSLLAMETGSFEFEIGDTEGRASFGDLVFCPSGISFRRRALSEVSFHHILYQPPSGEDNMPQPAPGKTVVADTVRLQSTFHYLRELQRIRGSAAPESRDAVNRLVSDLLQQCELERLIAESSAKPRDPVMVRAMLLIRESAFAHDFSMAKTAERLGLHSSQLSRRFQAAYGSTPVAYLSKLRLEEAKRLLVETNDTLEAVAGRCGYENGSYFCRVFTGKIGMNPSAYRLAYRI